MTTPLVLVDHGSYELQNLGDAAMLIATVERLTDLVPEATIAVVTVDREALWEVLPQAVAVELPPVPGWLPGRARVKWKRGAKLAELAAIPLRTSSGSVWPADGPLSHTMSLSQAIRESDVVLAAGGGYVNDIFAGHGGGVLRLLDRAQRLGRTTAMLGQGVGPLDQSRNMFRLAARVFVRLDVLTVREGVQGPELLQRMGVVPHQYSVTGDDAIHLAMDEVERRFDAGLTSAASTGIGLNIRKATYSGVDASYFETLRRFTTQLDRIVEGRFAAMPIASGDPHDDLAQILRCLPAAPTRPPIVEPPGTSWELVSRAAQCRIMVAASYHAAVFALAVGAPVVALTNSQYYEWKFGGLRELYGPQMVRLVAMGGERFSELVLDACTEAWEVGEGPRRGALETTRRLHALQQVAYETVASRLRD